MFGVSGCGGGVIWVCGLAGVGKSTFARFVAEHLHLQGTSVSTIDGDTFRRDVMPNAGYDRQSRLLVATAISERAWRDANEGSQCVVSTISLMREIHAANTACAARLSLNLRTVMVEAPPALRESARRQLYGKALDDVVGEGILPDYPQEVALRVNNSGSLMELQALATRWVDQTFFRNYAP